MIKTISKGFQLTIPAEVRKKMGITIGSKIDLEIKGETIIVTPLKEMSDDELLRAIKKTPKHKLTQKQLEGTEKELYD